MKAYTSDVTVRLVEICRQSCGGHGYLLSGGIGLLCNSALPLVTVEGENSVLYQQTARQEWAFSELPFCFKLNILDLNRFFPQPSEYHDSLGRINFTRSLK